MRAVVIELAGGSRRRVARERSVTEPDAAPAVNREETRLVDAAKAGNSRAFDDLVERHMRRAFSVAYRILAQRQDAEDAVQDAFLSALTNLDTFERGRPFGPWLLRIVANRAINASRARAIRVTEPVPASAAATTASPFETAARGELRGEVERALSKLPEQQRWIVELFELDGFTGPEIAGMLEIPEGTVRWQLHQARQVLRPALERFSVRTP